MCRDLNEQERQSVTALMQTTNMSMSWNARVDTIVYFFDRKVVVPAKVRNAALINAGKPPLPVPEWSREMVEVHLRFHLSDACVGATHLLNRLKTLEEVCWQNVIRRTSEGRDVIDPKELKNYLAIQGKEVKMYGTKLHISPFFNTNFAPITNKRPDDQTKKLTNWKPDKVQNNL
jgi:hypothetical protein